MSLAAIRLIGFILGIFLITLAVSMAIPMMTLVIYEHSDELSAFLWSSLITFICGLLLIVRGRPETGNLRPRDMYLLTTASWVVVCAFAALPMVFISDISYTDAFFETMSGITTTGSTVLTGLDIASPGLLIWRSMLHWLGGIGFIGMAVAILPLLRVGGMRLFSDRVLGLVGESDTTFSCRSQVHSFALSGPDGYRHFGALARRNDPIRSDQPRNVVDLYRRVLDVGLLPRALGAASNPLGGGSHHDPGQPAIHLVRRNLSGQSACADQGPPGTRVYWIPARHIVGSRYLAVFSQRLRMVGRVSYRGGQCDLGRHDHRNCGWRLHLVGQLRCVAVFLSDLRRWLLRLNGRRAENLPFSGGCRASGQQLEAVDSPSGRDSEKNTTAIPSTRRSSVRC